MALTSNPALLVGVCVIGGLLFVCCIFALLRYFCRRQRNRSMYSFANNPLEQSLAEQMDPTEHANANTTSVWMGDEGYRKLEQEKQQDRKHRNEETYNIAYGAAINFCRLAPPEFERRVNDPLSCINYRLNCKFFHAVSDQRLQRESRAERLMLSQYDLSLVPPLDRTGILAAESNSPLSPLGSARIVPFKNDETFRAFMLAMVSLESPFVHQCFEVGRSRDKSNVFFFHTLEREGSLRDHIHGTNLKHTYESKYNNKGKPLPIALVRRYGRHVLEGMRYLSACGIPNYHLHLGNVIIQNNVAKLSGYEASFFGLCVQNPYHEYLISLKRLFQEMDIEVMLFGYLMFEMSTGLKVPTANPLNAYQRLPRRPPGAVTKIIGRIFGDKSLGDCPTMEELLNDPFFEQPNIPPMDVSMYLALRDENTELERIRKAVWMQANCTYAKEVVKPAAAIQEKKKRKKKKKKKKRKKKAEDQAGGAPEANTTTSTASTGQPDAAPTGGGTQAAKTLILPEHKSDSDSDIFKASSSDDSDGSWDDY